MIQAILMFLLGVLLLFIVFFVGLAVVFARNRNILIFNQDKETAIQSRIFKQERPSFTAELVCIGRAVGTTLGFLHDEVAYEFLDYDAKIVAKFWSAWFYLGRGKLPIFQVPFIICRTHVIDRFVLQAKHCEQIVILGADLDARPYRLNVNNPKAKWFEVDAPATQKMKIQKVTDVQLRAPKVIKNTALKDGNVTYVSCNFATNEDFIEKLQEKGFNKENPNTIILLEGVASYLTWDELKATLSKIASCAPGTLFVMNCRTHDESKPNSFGKLLKSNIGEEWKFALSPTESAAEKFGPIGFKMLEDLTVEDAIAQTPGLSKTMVNSHGSIHGHIMLMQVTK